MTPNATNKSDDVQKRGLGGRHVEAKWLVFSTIFASMVAISYMLIQLEVASLGVGKFNDIWFDMDTADLLHPEKLQVSYRHPLLGVIVNGPSVLAAKALGLFLSVEQVKLREISVYGLISIVNGLSTFVLIRILRRMGIRLVAAVLIASVDSMCLCRMLTGSVVDSFAFTSLFLRLCILSSLSEPRVDAGTKFIALGSLGVFGIGVTITNGFLWFIVIVRKYVLNRTQGLKAAAAHVVVICSIACIVAFGGVLLLSPILNVPVKSVVGAFRYSSTNHSTWKKEVSIERGRKVLFAFTDSFVAPAPALIDTKLFDHKSDLFVTGRAVSYQREPSDVLGEVQRIALVGMCCILGAIGLAHGAASHRTVLWTSGAWLLFSIAINMAWGSDELFLYTMHWQSITILWFAGLFTSYPRYRAISYGLLTTLLLQQLWFNSQSVASAFKLLEAAVKQQSVRIN